MALIWQFIWCLALSIFTFKLENGFTIYLGAILAALLLVIVSKRVFKTSFIAIALGVLLMNGLSLSLLPSFLMPHSGSLNKIINQITEQHDHINNCLKVSTIENQSYLEFSIVVERYGAISQVIPGPNENWNDEFTSCMNNFLKQMILRDWDASSQLTVEIKMPLNSN